MIKSFVTSIYNWTVATPQRALLTKQLISLFIAAFPLMLLVLFVMTIACVVMLIVRFV